jgi:N-hydroxyarylamine O-acetyltransferase
MQPADLDAYFARIGYAGARTPTRPVLDAILGAHVQAIPFENLDILLGRGISLARPDIVRKLVHDRRGGYCFEHNGLLLAVLRTLGFHVTPLLARVRWQVPAGAPSPQTHMILRVELDGRPWLADGGFGGIGLTGPIALDTEAEQGVAPERRRLVPQGRHLLQQVRFGDAWSDVYRFTPDEAPAIDFEVGNWFTSTHPQSRFRQNLIVSRAAGDLRLSILNRELTIRRRDGGVEKRLLASPAELLDALARQFDLPFPAGTAFACPALDWPESVAAK